MLTFSKCKKRRHTAVAHDAKNEETHRERCIEKIFAPDLHLLRMKGHFVRQNKTSQAIAWLKAYLQHKRIVGQARTASGSPVLQIGLKEERRVLPVRERRLKAKLECWGFAQRQIKRPFVRTAFETTWWR